MSTEPRFSLLFRKYVDGTAIHDERLEFLALANQENMQAELAQLIDAELRLRGTEYSLDEEEQQEILSHIYKTAPARTRKLWPRIAGMAAAVIGIAICIWLYRPADAPLSSRVSTDLNDIAPGGNRATLTVANGNTINLSDKKNGVVVGDDIKYTDGTDIAPLSSRTRPDLSGANAKDLSLEVSVPRGGTYSVILQDGTKVWLNADSKLEFYSNYRNKLQRIVKLIKGEAYLEVAKDAKRPFIVESKGQRVEVLGTHFNISAYSDDVGIKTTLLEGSVRVSPTLSSGGGMTKQREDVVLKPGQQSFVTANNKITIQQVDANEVIAWKNGKFRFVNTSLKDVLLQLSRWYDVDIKYENGMPDRKFTGGINRNSNASVALDILRVLKVNFKIDGKTIIVSQ